MIRKLKEKKDKGCDTSELYGCYGFRESIEFNAVILVLKFLLLMSRNVTVLLTLKFYTRN
jgi:hypothetical protein